MYSQRFTAWLCCCYFSVKLLALLELFFSASCLLLVCLKLAVCSGNFFFVFLKADALRRGRNLSYSRLMP